MPLEMTESYPTITDQSDYQPLTASGIPWKIMSNSGGWISPFPCGAYFQSYLQFLKNQNPVTSAAWLLTFSPGFSCKIEYQDLVDKTVHLIAAASDPSPIKCMIQLDTGLTPRLDRVKSQIADEMYQREQARWVALQKAAADRARLDQANAEAQAEAERLALILARDEAEHARLSAYSSANNVDRSVTLDNDTVHMLLLTIATQKPIPAPWVAAVQANFKSVWENGQFRNTYSVSIVVTGLDRPQIAIAKQLYQSMAMTADDYQANAWSTIAQMITWEVSAWKAIATAELVYRYGEEGKSKIDAYLTSDGSVSPETVRQLCKNNEGHIAAWDTPSPPPVLDTTHTILVPPERDVVEPLVDITPTPVDEKPPVYQTPAKPDPTSAPIEDLVTNDQGDRGGVGEDIQNALDVFRTDLGTARSRVQLWLYNWFDEKLSQVVIGKILFEYCAGIKSGEIKVFDAADVSGSEAIADYLAKKTGNDRKICFDVLAALQKCAIAGQPSCGIILVGSGLSTLDRLQYDGVSGAISSAIGTVVEGIASGLGIPSWLITFAVVGAVVLALAYVYNSLKGRAATA